MFAKLLLVLCSVLTIIWCENPVVQISTGKVEGVKSRTIGQNKTYFSFKGIRYAEKPERFERSIPAKPWTNVYNATYDRPGCYQLDLTENQSEDCLFINVYTPNLSKSKQLTVMFWIYGGSFNSGNSTYALYGPDYFLDEQNVVFVSLNYRLQAYGFLSSGDARLPGNYGIKDVLLGLQWVQQNIAGFGGDPKKVTIFGESAGGTIASILVQSPATIGKGYFQRAILQSGNGLNAWGLQRNPKRMFETLAATSGCYSAFSDFNTTLNCLKQQDINVLQLACSRLNKINSNFIFDFLNGLTFAPTLEPASKHAVLVEGSYDFLTNKKHPNVPILIGGTSEESLQPRSALVRPLLLLVDLIPEMLVPKDIYATSNDVYNIIAPKLHDYYFPNTSVVSATDERIIKFLSDTSYNSALREFLTLLKHQTSVYCYILSYSNNLQNSDNNYTGLGKVPHESDLLYLFNTNANFTKKDKLTRSRMIKLWTNFAVYGNPTPISTPLLNDIIWPLADQNGCNAMCLDIGDDLKIINNPFDKAYQMWKQLYNTYGHPRDTYK